MDLRVQINDVYCEVSGSLVSNLSLEKPSIIPWHHDVPRSLLASLATPYCLIAQPINTVSNSGMITLRPTPARRS